MERVQTPSDGDGCNFVSSDQATTEAERIVKEELELSSLASGYKRSLSGNILSRLTFLRPSSEARNTNISKHSSPPFTSTGNTLKRLDNNPSIRPNNAVSPGRKTRSRRGSLRKTALLGGGKLRTEKEKRSQAQDLNNPNTLEIASTASQASSGPDDSPIPPSPDSDDYPTPRPSLDKSASLYSGSLTHNPGHLKQNQERSTSEESLLLHSTVSQQSTSGDTSTTDEDESLKVPQRLQVHVSATPTSLKKHSEAYFPLESSLQRRRSSNRARSPLAALPMEPIPSPEEWDYSETEWWGWVILILTWVVFVMGMGSCFGVWSWAWDVGETPYAPPELEDDPTLPIVGYYPALIILTGVMAWVWVVVAWVGMKYFRHAKISGDV